MTPVLPTRSHPGLGRLEVPKPDCVFSEPTEVQSDVTCAASATGATTVTATLTDSTRRDQGRLEPADLRHRTPPARSPSACRSPARPRATSTLGVGVHRRRRPRSSATLTDTATGQPIKGLAAAFTKQAPAARPRPRPASATSAANGTATVSQTVKVATTFAREDRRHQGVRRRHADLARHAPSASARPDLDRAAVSTLDAWYGDPVTVSGTLTRDVGRPDRPRRRRQPRRSPSPPRRP